MTASTAQVVTLTSDLPDNTDYNAIGAAVSSISTNLGDFSNHVMTIASINETSDIQNDRLLQAAKNLCNAFGNFLKLVEPEANEVNFYFFYILFYPKTLTLIFKPRQTLFSAVSKIGEASNEVMRNICENEMTNVQIQVN
jgi:talin